MEQRNLKKIFEDNGLVIFQGPSLREYEREIKRVDKVFYVETNGKVKYSEFHPIKMLEYVFFNMVKESERQRLKERLRKTFGL